MALIREKLPNLALHVIPDVKFLKTVAHII